LSKGFIDDLHHLIEKHRQVDVMFLDFAKAFGDDLHHLIEKHKLDFAKAFDKVPHN